MRCFPLSRTVYFRINRPLCLWPSAVKTKKIQHADANSQTQPGTNLHRRVPYLGDRSADEQCSPLHARIGAGAWSRREMRIRIWWRRGWCVAYVIRTDRRGTYSVGVDDLIDPSRSAIVGVSGFWKCQRFCRLSKMRACIAGAYVLAHVRRAASPLGVMRHYGRVRV